MKILLLDDNKEKITKQNKECTTKYIGATIVPILVSETTQPPNLIAHLITVEGSLNEYDFVFADVNMPTSRNTLSLLCALRKNGLLSPIVLISTDKGNQAIPTNILGKNADQNEYLYRRYTLPSQKELREMQAFSSKEEIPTCETAKSHLIALAILCQGYLAAHGLLDSLKGKGIEINEDKIRLTASPGWWKIITTSQFIQQEIDSLNCDIKTEKGESAKDKIQELISSLKESAVDGLTGKVQDAYNAFCALEKSGRSL